MPLRILLCDDNTDAVGSLAVLLEEEGYEPSVCYSAKACVEKARQCAPHLVVVDIGLPDASGHWVAEQIRRMPFGKDVVLVAFTGQENADDLRAGVAAGFDAHMTKGQDPVLLLELAARLSRDGGRDAHGNAH